MTAYVSMVSSGRLATLAMAAGVALAVLGVAAALVACGGSADAQAADASSPPMTVLDVDELGTPDAVAQEAAAARGAPGDAEPVVYVVRARRAHDAVRVAAELTRRGFSDVRVDGDPQTADASASR
jgi:hypothetical protein